MNIMNTFKCDTMIMYIILIAFLKIPAAYAQDSGNVPEKPSVQNASDNLVPAYASMLINAYPDQNMKYADNHIYFDDGTSIVFDDGANKDFNTMMDNSDIEDMFSMKYIRENSPGYLQDAGRSRCEPLFKKMYGNNASSVRKTLVDVDWFGAKIKFTRINGAADQLKKVADEIRQEHPELIPYMKSSGTFYWRKVRHANRLSAHSYGIAIDIAVKQSDYWKWGYPKASETDVIEYKNRIPVTIAEIFEKHGFIWGGRWFHYDTMHFEYRPEILQNDSAHCNTK